MTWEQFRALLDEPEPRDIREALVRNRSLQQGMAVRAVEACEELYPDIRISLDESDGATLAYLADTVMQAAEQKWPGFRSAASRLVEREQELLCRLEPTC